MVRRLLLSLTLIVVVPVSGCGPETSEEPNRMEVGPKRVKLETSMGDIVIELDEEAAPITVQNFLRYVGEGFYDGMIFHRVRRINPLMIQGGGFTVEMKRKATHEPIINEARNGLKNERGTIAMARTALPNSATSQFYINHQDNDGLNYVAGRKHGYAVFGRVVAGMDVVDAISAVRTAGRGPYPDVPAELVVIKSAKVVLAK
ncbi:MAG: peptidylprolyl isomerase [Planctomycetota bacterium]|jgi:cyclophilin family peptidyl-prolyl cis-trans isomerase